MTTALAYYQTAKIALVSDRLKSPYLAQAATSLGQLNKTPLDFLRAQLSPAILALNGGVTANTEITISESRVLLNNISLKSQSGATLAFDSPIAFAGSAPLSRGIATLSGGGFPTMAVRHTADLKRQEGTITVASLVASNTRLSLAPVSFLHNARGTKIATSATFEGPIAGGSVQGLRAPIAAIISTAGKFALVSPCLPLVFDSATFNTITLNRTAATLCLRGRDMTINAPQLAGRASGQTFSVSTTAAHYNLGNQALALGALNARFGPATITAAALGYSLTNNHFTLSKVVSHIGAAPNRTEIDADAITGALVGGTFAGSYRNANGVITHVPLSMTKSSGTWTFRGGMLALKGNVLIDDANPIPPSPEDLAKDKNTPSKRHFNTLAVDDMALTYKNSHIAATGTLKLADTAGAFVSKIALTHDLSTTKGDAILDLRVPVLRFSKTFRPEDLTALTVGIIQNAAGDISGQGRIHWTANGVTSDGDFSTDSMQFDAMIGPVRGVRGAIHFTDLLGLVTAPHQTIYLGAVNPGVLVRDGVIHYRVLPANKVEIEGGYFPLAGGRLVLEPTVLDFSESAERRITFRVEGVEAGKFINEMKFEDIAATGVFDGRLPMIFDSKGGRIEGGQIAVREAGGVVSYVGPVSNAALGRWGKLAFEALKAIKYRGLAIDVDGPLDGEMVSLVKFSGTNDSSKATKRSFILKQISGIPFKFNIRITAPFRSLFTSAANLQDPSNYVQQQLPKNYKASAPPPAVPSVNPPATPVQPKESDTVR